MMKQKFIPTQITNNIFRDWYEDENDDDYMI